MNPARPKRYMIDEDDDPILDAGLDEILGGLRPPDLSEPVVRALESGEIPAHLLAAVDSLSRQTSIPVEAPPVVHAISQPANLEVSAPAKTAHKLSVAMRHGSHRLHSLAGFESPGDPLL